MNQFFVKLALASVFCASALFAHPMGNFSVSHYAKLQVTASGVELEYVLDLAEIPTSALLTTWNLDRSAPASALDKRAVEQAKEWLKNLSITAGGHAVRVRFESAKLAIADGAGNLPILRITTRAHIDSREGQLAYEDHNYPERAGWKEIVIAQSTGATLREASQTSRDISQALTQYPADPMIAPPQDLRAEMAWTSAEPLAVVAAEKPSAVAPAASRASASRLVVKEIPQPRSAPPASAPAAMTSKAAPPGSVVRGDFLSRLLHQRQLTPWMILVALAAAFALGAAHALTPGHGKAIVAAYLVGSRGTLKHAAFLGAMVTFTHTITVFALGIATLFLYRYIVPEKITEILGVISGLSIVILGAWMLYKRIKGARHSHAHDHDHRHVHTAAHSHTHTHVHDHEHELAHAAAHSHAHAREHHSHGDSHSHDHDHDHSHHHHHEHTHDHSHGGHSHSHVPDEISWKGLAALGASGGLVPCESALVLLLGAIALGRVGLGLLLLLSFSLGLALVLVTIGALVLYAKNLLPEGSRSGRHPLLRFVSIASPAIVIVVGLAMTAVSLGWIQSKWMIG